ncbi:probable chitinase 10 [Daphnia pulex]|uniref:probable chitinase 10 n=1 Tax=Daphnia pulex TaxID=6669 RepID=UPI001EDE48FB|nr:probable chitinase 10 [Daphnia pulex]
MNLLIKLIKIVTLLQLSSLPIILHGEPGKRIVCSFPNWAFYRTKSGGAAQYTVDNIDPTMCTHVLYSFALLDKSTFKIAIKDQLVDIDNQGYSKSVALKTQNPQLKVMISLGGWTDANDGSKKYAALIANDSNIDTFVSSVVDFLQLHHFDGLDLDYDYIPNAVVKTSFARLLVALSTAFSPKGYLLSLALPAAPSDYSSSIGGDYDVSSLNENVNFTNLRAFHLHGSWEPTVADHHSPLLKRPWETNNLNANFAVTYWTNLGLLASKINLGIPLFGLSWTLPRSLSSDSFIPPATAEKAGPSEAKMAFFEICSSVRKKGWEVFPDPFQRIGPYAVSPTDPKTWVGYDDPAMAIVKSQFILSKGLGGAFLWDISNDDFKDICGLGVNPITTAIYHTLNGLNTTCDCVCYDN